MVWGEDYLPGHSAPRQIGVPDTLYNCMKRYSEKKGCSCQHIFDQALVVIWRMWNGNTTTNDPASHISERNVRRILDSNPPPKIEKKRNFIYIQFKGQVTFDFVKAIEELYMVESTNDFIKRAISYYLRTEGYLKDEIQQKSSIDIEKKLDIDTVD